VFAKANNAQLPPGGQGVSSSLAVTAWLWFAWVVTIRMKGAAMFVRITRYQMRPDAIATATAKLRAMQDKIMSMPGAVQHLNVLNPDGNGYVVTVSESREISDSNAEHVAALWAEFAEFMAAPPEPQGDGFDVVANWTAG
jgi:hypothetical protein